MTTDSFMQYTETTAAQEIEVTVGQSHRQSRYSKL